jgi:ribosomal protein L37AE/L43A
VSLSPRKVEVEAIIEILERAEVCPTCNGESVHDEEKYGTFAPCETCMNTGQVSAWDTPEELAKALLRETFKIIQQREQLYLVAAPFGDGKFTAFGPYAGAADAATAASKSIYPDSQVFPIFGEQLMLPDENVQPTGNCICGHPKATHEHQKGRGWCWAKGGSIKSGNICGCQLFVLAAA